MYRFALISLLFSGLVQAGELPSDLQWQSNWQDPVFASDEAKRGGTLRSYMLSFPQTLRSVGPDANSGIRFYIMDGTPKLAQRHPNTGKWIPQLADEWAFSDDYKTAYFKLNPKVKWSDGEMVTADDYLFMLTYYRSKDIIDPWYNDFFRNTIASVEKFDDYTISITVSEPKSNDELMVLLNTPNHGLQPRPQHYFANINDQNGDGMDDNFVRKYNFKAEPTTSPYYISKINKGRSITFKHVGDNWWGYGNKYYQNRFNVDKLRIKVIRDSDIARKHFEKGKLDTFTMVLPQLWHEKTDSAPFAKGYIQKFWGFNQTSQGAGGLWMNTSMPLLSDINVRKGITFATDFDGMIKNVLRGDYSRKPHAMGYGHGDYDLPDAKAPAFEPELAIGYFEAAGFTNIGPDGIRVNKNGERLSFKITYGYNIWTPRIAYLKEQAKLAGLELNLNLVDGSAAFKYILEKKHQLAFLNMGGGELPAYKEYFHSSNANRVQTNNHTNYSSLELDREIEAFNSEFDADKKYQLSREIQKLISNAFVIVPGYMVPYTRDAHWRWVKYPNNPMTKKTGAMFNILGTSNFWIDTELKQQTQLAYKEGETFEPVTVIDERYRL
ncbi:Diguanylate cyclase [Vibrio harveyi]|uniref:extracellular solute-binding protein n=1 Tax=Vibrio harveyi TaxID=669 RepID=UPI000680970F|nr:extracellular solute-binding protein [Vibrio harveyi]APP07926.1 ABC transporter substrate-binding protein [Vibrio harveyi]EKO3782141.1 ABC transporter substrate-binding protein [Vibrio harveyi]EKO3822474.1 ABC transporter substrate-binding protein [Vibrio harveyi]EKO3829698.1 ABC transporter substrate-binding protein [Vibrio harveyi]ELC3158524.1 ABC transporter substrate-binding protein [Vibrio harveyi]